MEAKFSAELLIIVVLTALIVGGNVLILIVLLWTDSFKNINKCFFASLAFADMIIGLAVMPFAIVSALYQKWVFQSENFCHILAYLTATCWIASLYSIMWINVDHYLALRKPERYSAIMSPVRSACWVVLVWLAALCYCSPPMFTKHRARYYHSIHMCVVTTEKQRFYFITSALLIALPPLITTIATSTYLFTESYRKIKSIYNTLLLDKACRSENYQINAINSCLFAITWLPWCTLQTYLLFSDQYYLYSSRLHFYCLWIAMGNSCYRFIIYSFCSTEFQRGTRSVFQMLLGVCRGDTAVAANPAPRRV